MRIFYFRSRIISIRHIVTLSDCLTHKSLVSGQWSNEQIGLIDYRIPQIALIIFQHRTVSSDVNANKAHSDKGQEVNKAGGDVKPYFITGFVDGEGCFVISVLKNQKLKIGWEVQVFFIISLHKKDRALLKLIQSSFNDIGSITKHGKDSLQYRVASIRDLEVVISYFDKYILITKKKSWLSFI
jgi:hypothetical protein